MANMANGNASVVRLAALVCILAAACTSPATTSGASGCEQSTTCDGVVKTGSDATVIGYQTHATTAAGVFATAMGQGGTTSGDTATAMGRITIASGFVSTAMECKTSASGFTSTAIETIIMSR